LWEKRLNQTNLLVFKRAKMALSAANFVIELFMASMATNQVWPYTLPRASKYKFYA